MTPGCYEPSDGHWSSDPKVIASLAAQTDSLIALLPEEEQRRYRELLRSVIAARGDLNSSYVYTERVDQYP